MKDWYTEMYQHKLLVEQEFARDAGANTNTITFKKRSADGDWSFRRWTWEYGPLYVPAHDEASFVPLTLIQVMDRERTIVDDVCKSWVKWKATHPEIFPS